MLNDEELRAIILINFGMTDLIVIAYWVFPKTNSEIQSRLYLPAEDAHRTLTAMHRNNEKEE